MKFGEEIQASHDGKCWFDCLFTRELGDGVFEVFVEWDLPPIVYVKFIRKKEK